MFPERASSAPIVAGSSGPIRWLVCAALALGAASPSRPAPLAKPRITLFVPAYFYPGGSGEQAWNALIEASATVPVTAIVNPASGPGRKADPSYTAVLQRAAKAGVKLIGYVSTSYGKRPAPEVEADLERWQRFYPDLRGYFFDEQPSGAEQADQYARLTASARSRIADAVVITNPGTTCAEEYLTKAKLTALCLFEDHNGVDQFRLPTWAAHHDPDHFAVIPYGVADAAGMQRCLDRAVSERAGRVYVTDDVLPNPWDRLPGYWKAEVDEVRKRNGGG